ncbi:MAG: anti-sigma factor antagonist [Candidatus Cloacimonetes bacterium]|nr:anti-sigma factor antagonist [Candidatus Cloacimonadota bacterium]
MADMEQLQFASILIDERTAKDGVITIRMSSELDHGTLKNLRSLFQREWDAENWRLVLNLKNLKFIYSAHIGVIWAFVQKMQKAKGGVHFCQVPESVLSAFNTLGLTKVMKIYDTEDQAFKAFS